MKRKFFCVTLIITLVFCSFPLSTQAASTIPVITHPTNQFVHNSNHAITITWDAPSGTVSNYILSVRHLSANKQNPVTDDYLIVKRVSLSASTRSYKIPWSKLAYSSTYRISVCAVMSDGTQRWSKEYYFFTTTYNVVANKTFSFYLYEGFPTEWKNAIYYAAQAWRGAMGLEYEVVNTYPFSQCHNNNTVIKGDGKNRITSATPDIDDPPYVMATKKH